MSKLVEHLSELVLAHILAELVIAGGLAVLGRFAIFAGRRPLRTRMSVGIVSIGLIGLAVLSVGAPPSFTLGLCTAATLVLAAYVLKDISKVGIVNSFPTTSLGITPPQSLQLITKNLDFLGIGAKKLTDDTSEFAKMVERCRGAGGHVRLLLSTPNNPALAALSKRNGRDPSSYASRVRESIGQALHIQSTCGADLVTIKLYELGGEFALPHFRLMFIDQEICILSHLLWNSSEGMDNPQLIIRSNKGKSTEKESLYSAYHNYFEDLWNDPASKVVTDTDDPRLA